MQVSPGMHPPHDPPQPSSPHTLGGVVQFGTQNPTPTLAPPAPVALASVTEAVEPVSVTAIVAVPWCSSVPSEANDFTVITREIPTGVFCAVPAAVNCGKFGNRKNVAGVVMREPVATTETWCTRGTSMS